MALELRSLGRSQLKLSQLGLGTVKLGRNTDVKYPAGFELPSDEAVVELLNEASRLGINVLDTAPAYGHSETRLGDLLPGYRVNSRSSPKSVKPTIPQPEVSTISVNAPSKNHWRPVSND